MAPKTNRERIHELREQGLTPRQIATLLHLSTQWVYQVLNETKEAAS